MWNHSTFLFLSTSSPPFHMLAKTHVTISLIFPHSALNSPHIEHSSAPHLSRTVHSSMTTVVDNDCGLHSPRSVIHRAIVANDIDFIRGLFAEPASPDIFCFGDGRNCFFLAAATYSSSTEETKRDAYWRLLDTMLELDPRGINAKSENGESLLMHFCNEVDKIKHLVALKADVNAKDYRGYSVLKISSHKNFFVEFNSQAFKLLLSYGATPSKEFLHYLVLELDKGKEHRVEAARALIEIFQHPHTFARTLSTLPKNPLYLLCHINMKSCSFLSGCKAALQNLCLSNSIKQEASITYAIVPNESGGPQWNKLHKMMQLPKKLKLNVVGAFLYRLHLLDMSEANLNVVADCLQIMIENNLATTSTNKETVHPLHALLYNMFKTSENVLTEVYENWTIIMSHLLHKCMMALKDLPFRHRLFKLHVNDVVHGNNITPHIDLMILITPLMVTADDKLMECVMALLQLNPVHPFQHTPYLHKFVHSLASSHLEQFRSIFAPKLVYQLLDSCGALTVAGLHGSNVQNASMFYSFCLDISLSSETTKDKAIEKIKNKTLLKTGEVSSLKFLASMQIRKTLYRNRSSSRTPLPLAIRSLFTDRILPKSLESDLLVYKPNKNLNF